MAISTINIGNVVNDGLGDDLRTAFQKVNANFQDLQTQLSVRVTARNIGETGEGIFAQAVGNELQFKNIVQGSGIELEWSSSSVVIKAVPPVTFVTLNTFNDSNVISAAINDQLTFIGSSGIEVTSSGSNVNFGLTEDTISAINAYDFGPLNGVYPNVVSFLLSSSNIDFGSISTPASLNLDLGAIV